MLESLNSETGKYCLLFKELCNLNGLSEKRFNYLVEPFKDDTDVDELTAIINNILEVRIVKTGFTGASGTMSKFLLLNLYNYSENGRMSSKFGNNDNDSHDVLVIKTNTNDSNGTNDKKN